MQAENPPPGGPSSPRPSPVADPRLRLVDRAMQLYHHEGHALIETLHAAQQSFGYLDEGMMRYIAGRLRLPLSRVFAVATFYHAFTLKPPGQHTCVICLGTACYIGGSKAILDGICDRMGIGVGETTTDGKVSLLVARCLGSCGLAPAGVFDGEVAGRLNPQEVLDRIGRWHDDDPA